MRIDDTKQGSIKLITALIIVSAAVLVCSAVFLRGTDAKIDRMIHAKDEEDRYAGVGGRPTTEAEIDYMILKYSNGVNDLEEDEYDPGDDEDKDRDEDDGNKDDQEKDDQDKDDQDKDDDKEPPEPEGPDENWKDKIFLAYKGVETHVTINPPKDVVYDDVYDAMNVECRYKTGEDGIFVNKFGMQTIEHDDYVTWNLSLGYSRAVDEIRNMKKDTAAKEDDEAGTLDVDGMTDEQKINLVNQFVCDYVEYSEQSDPGMPDGYPDQSHTAWGALFEHSAVCDGFSRTVKMICDDIGLNCYIVIGDVIGAGGHAWNLVEIDGKWYHLDVTWNDGCGDRSMYYLIPDSYLEPYRVWDHSLYPEVATSPYVR